MTMEIIQWHEGCVGMYYYIHVDPPLTTMRYGKGGIRRNFWRQTLNFDVLFQPTYYR